MKTYSMESELRAIATICDAPQEVRATAFATLSEDHFASPETQELWARLNAMAQYNQPIPRVETLQHDPALSEDAREIVLNRPRAAEDQDDYGAILAQLEQYRQVRCIYEGVRGVTAEFKEVTTETIDKSLQALESTLMRARSRGESIKLVEAGHKDADAVIDKVLDQSRMDRIQTGFRRFDEASGGFARKDLVLIAATTGGGKSVMAEQLAINGYLLDHRRVCLVSFEMDEEEVYARLIANLTGIPFDRIYLRKLTPAQITRCREAWRAFYEYGEKHGGRFVVWCPTIEVTPAQVAQILKPGCYDEVLVDYVGLVKGEDKKELWQNLGNITRTFKLMANQQRCVVIVFAQLDEESNKVKYAKAMRHHSSYVWWWNYDDEAEQTGQVTIEQGKARHCKRFPFDVLADFSCMAFRCLDGGTPARDLIVTEEPRLRGDGPIDTVAMDAQTKLAAAISAISEDDDMDL